MNPYQLQAALQSKDIVTFARDVLGMDLNPGQIYWLRNAWKLVNILKPANQWGKTTAEAIVHIYQAVCKPALTKFNMGFDDWFQVRYLTLNFGKTYEISKGVMEAILEITEGRYLLPDGKFNKSLLAGWSIVKIEDTPKLPRIIWFNHSETLVRSYDGLGESFKRLRLAFVSGDECGDIPELNLFLTGTLMPRVAFYQGIIHLVGTAQPKGVEYEEIAEFGENEMRELGDKSNYFVLSANNNPDLAMIFQNKFMDKAYLEKIEATADPELKKQIIYGMYVDWASHLYTWDEVNQMFKSDMPYDPETGFSEEPQKDCYYAMAVDMAAGDDETSVTVIRYNIKKKDERTGITLDLPHKVVFHKAWKGKTLPLSLQYQIIKEMYEKFRAVSPYRTYFIYDAGSLGGKNAGEAFQELKGYPFPPAKRSYAEVKAEGMGKVKEVLGRNRDFIVNEKGVLVDKNPNWGGIKASPAIKELRRQLETASKDDDKIKNDQYTSFMMALHFIENRIPKLSHTKAVDFNFNRLL